MIVNRVSRGKNGPLCVATPHLKDDHRSISLTMFSNTLTDPYPTTPERPSGWRSRRITPTSSPRSGRSSGRSTGSGGKVKRWFNKSPTYSPPSVTAQRLRDITNPNPFVVEAMDEDHFPSATSKSNPAPPKFPNRVKAAVSHNEYCLLGQVFLTLTNAPQVVYDWFEELGKNAKGVRNTARSLAAVTGLGKKACEDAIQMTRHGGEVSVPPMSIFLIFCACQILTPPTFCV